MTRITRYTLLAIVALVGCQQLFAGGKPEKFIGTTWKGVDNKLFGTVFTQLTPENAGKWREAEPSQGMFAWPILDQMFSIAEKRHIVIKEHTLIWYQQAPR